VEGLIEDRSTQGVVVIGIQVRGPDERPNGRSARVPTRRNGAAADRKPASDVIRLRERRGKLSRESSKIGASDG
jgi:hypothetical protein